MLKKKILLPVLALALLIGTVGGSVVHAQSNNQPSLAQMIAQKFGLDQNAVQSVVDQYRSNQKTNMQSKMQNRVKSILDQEVSQGKITSAQEQAILQELATLRSQNNPKTRQAFQNEQNQLKSWGQSQGINPSLIPGFGRGFGRGMRGWVKASPTPTP